MFIGLLNACTVESFGGLLASNSKGPVRCISLNNRPCQSRPILADTNSNKNFFIHLLSVLINVVEVVILSMICMFENLFWIK